jgi:hypothetical protein
VVDAVVLPPDRILVFPEGFGDQALPVYNTTTDAWSALAPPDAAPGTGTDDVFVLATDGFVYHFTSGAEAAFVHRYHPATNAYEATPVAVLDDLYVTDAIAQADGSILLFPLQSAIRSFDPTTGEVSALSTEASGYRWAEPGLPGTIFVIGSAQHPPEVGYSEAGCLDPETGRVEPYGPTPPMDILPLSVGNGPDGRTYVFGNPLTQAPASPWAFDHQSGTWAQVPLPLVLRTGPLVVAGPDERLYLIGGGPVPFPGVPVVEPMVEVFEPEL